MFKLVSLFVLAALLCGAAPRKGMPRLPTPKQYKPRHPRYK